MKTAAGIFCTFLLTLGTVLHGGELLKDTQFKSFGKKNSPWYTVQQGAKTASGCSVEKGVLKLEAKKGAAVFACQKLAAAVPGKTYQITFEAKAAPGSNVNSYVEWCNKGNKFQNKSLAKKMTAGQEWKKYTYTVSLSSRADFKKTLPYIVWRVRNAGTFYIRNPRVTAEELPILKNAAFKSGKDGISSWYIVQRGAKKNSSVSAKDGVLTLKSAVKGAGIYFCQKLNVEKGKRYQVEFEVKGIPGSDIGSYVEWVNLNGKYRNQGLPRGTKAGKEWKRCTYVFQIDDNVNMKRQIPFIALRIRDKGEASFRNLRLKPLVVYDKIQNAKCEEKTGWQSIRSSHLAASGGYAGSGALFLKNPGAAAVQKDILLSGGSYKLTFTVTGKENRTSANGFSEYSVTITDNTGKVLGGGAKGDCFNDAWQRKEISFKAAPNTACRILCRSFSNGFIVFDNFKLEKLKADEIKPIKVLVDSPWYRNMIYSSDPVSEIAGTVTVSNEVKTLRASFGKGKMTVLSVKNGKAAYSFPAGKLAVGKYPLNFEAVLKNGKVFKESIIIRKLPKAKNELIVKKDLNVYWNGKPYFLQFDGAPLFHRHPGGPIYLKTMNAIPFHWADIPPGKLIKNLMNTARDNGCKFALVIPLHHLYSKNQEPEKFWKVWQKWMDALTPDILENDAHAGYFLFDEVLWNGVPLEIVKKCYEDLKNKDPYHPIFSCEAPRGMPDDWRPYTPYCDVFAIDIYPVPESSNHSELPEKGMRSVGEYTKLAIDAVDNRKPVRMALQAFSWGVLNYRKNELYPTKKEFRFMYFDAMLHGARSLGYFSVSLHRKDVCRDIFDCVVEMDAISPAFLLGKEQKCTVSDKNIMAKLFELKGKKYLIASNRSDKKIKAELSLADGRYHVLGEKRTVSAASGKVRDTFEPWEIHIYSDSPEYPQPPKKLSAEEERLLDEYMHLRTSRMRNFKSNAYWIWSPENVKKCYIVRKFKADKNTVKALLRCSGDDYFTAYINGKEILKGSNWHFYREADLSKYLVNGENTIAIEAGDWVGAKGFIAELQLTGKDGKVRKIVTDSSWQTAVKPVPADWKTKGPAGSVPAKQQAVSGKGPWRY